MSKLLPEGTYVGYPVGGAPPEPLEPPQGSPGVLEVFKNCKNFQKLYKNFICRKIPQTITSTPILGYLDVLGGARGSKSSRGGGRAFLTPNEKF